MAKLRPAVKTTETYTESNFLRLHTAPAPPPLRVVTLEHLRYGAADSGGGGWHCETIVDGEAMSKEDALFIARSYAQQHEIPVIYECHGD